MPDYDAVIVGSGPNGLAAAITLAQAGLSVLVLEAQPTIGGGTRSAELTLPGYVHDICSAFHPLGMGGPFLRNLPLADHGLRWIQPPLPLAHPLDDGSAVLLERSLEAMDAVLGRDAAAYKRLFGPLVRHWESLFADILAPIRFPKHPLLYARFGARAGWPASILAQALFREEQTRGFFAGMAAHSMLPLHWLVTSSFGLVLGTLGHAVGWPLAEGGSGRIADALASYLKSLGGTIQTDSPVEDIGKLPISRLVLLDVTPRQVVKLTGDRLPSGYRKQLERYRYGPGVFKIDWALSQPIPWKAEDVKRAGTVHLGGTLPEIARSESAALIGQIADAPFVLLGQQSLFDPSRAPAGKQTAWAYCHVPNGSTIDMTERIERQIERFAPGFRDCILARHTFSPAEMEQHNANYIGGDINGGMQDLRQLFTRPVPRRDPYSTPLKGVFLCSSATPPGGGVHGMCGYYAAQAALRTLR